MFNGVECFYCVLKLGVYCEEESLWWGGGVCEWLGCKVGKEGLVIKVSWVFKWYCFLSDF